MVYFLFITYNWWYMLILYVMISFHPKGLYAKLYIPDLTTWIIVCFHLNLLPFLIPCIMFSCSGLTNSNYTELSQLYEKYKSKGFLSSLFYPYAFVLFYFPYICFFLVFFIRCVILLIINYLFARITNFISIWQYTCS